MLLIDTGTGYKYLDEWKGDLWNAAGIPSPSADTETNEAIVFGYLVAWFLGEVRNLSAWTADCTCAYANDHQLSLSLMSVAVQWLLISTNGLLVSPCR